VVAFGLVLPFVLAYLYVGLCLDRISRRTGTGRRWWAWVPPLNVLLPFRVAGRSTLWGLTFLLPPLNLATWTLVWAEVCARLQRPRKMAFAMLVPAVNLALLGTLAGLDPSRVSLALGLLACSIPVAGVSHAARHRARVEAQVRSLKHPDPRVRRAAASALAPAGEAVGVQALAESLKDPDPGVRAEAARALGQSGPAAAPAVPTLVAALADESDAVRGQAARALGAITREPAVPADLAVPALLQGAKGWADAPMPDVGLIDVLARMGPSAGPSLVAGLQDSDAGVRWHAAAALMRLGHAASAAAPALLAAMDDAQWTVRNAAGRALEEVVSKSDVPALAGALIAGSAETRYHVARALARVGPGAAAAVPTLGRALADPDWEVRTEAAWALAAVGPAARDALPALVAALRDENTEVRRSAAWSIGQVGGSGAAPALREALKDEDREVRDAAARVLARIEGAAR
jgi:HEAT repeat protein